MGKEKIKIYSGILYVGDFSCVVWLWRQGGYYGKLNFSLILSEASMCHIV